MAADWRKDGDAKTGDKGNSPEMASAFQESILGIIKPLQSSANRLSNEIIKVKNNLRKKKSLETHYQSINNGKEERK